MTTRWGEAKAIETRYAGHLFRSRLEARYAVFFDALGVRWEYEPEGFELGDGVRYLPDFWLPDLPFNAWTRHGTEHGCWLEVKPTDPTDNERSKALGLAAVTKKCVWVAIGVPSRFATRIDSDPSKIERVGDLKYFRPDGEWDGGCGWFACDCQAGQSVFVGIAGWGECSRCHGYTQARILESAAERARSARFEHSA